MTRAPGRREVLALVIVLAGFAAATLRDVGRVSEDFDEHVYLGSADALAAGAGLGSDLFASQPPLFYSALRAAWWAASGDQAVVRSVFAVLALLGVVAAWALVRQLGGPVCGVAAAAFVAVSPEYIDRAAVVSADVPSVALAVGALAAAEGAGRRRGLAPLAGALLAAALLVKLLALPFVVAMAVLVWRRRWDGWRLTAFAAGAAVLVAAALAPYAGALGDLWHDSVGVRSSARASDLGDPVPSGRIALPLAALALVALAAVVLQRGRLRRWVDDVAPLVALVGAALLFWAVHRPFFPHHLVIVGVPLALLAAAALRGVALPVVAAAAAVVLIAAAPLVIEGRGLLDRPSRERMDALAAAVRREVPQDGVVVSDLPLVPLLAGRDAAPETVDASYVRIEGESLTAAGVLAAARDADAIVIGRGFARMPGLRDALLARFPRVERVDGAELLLPARRAT